MEELLDEQQQALDVINELTLAVEALGAQAAALRDLGRKAMENTADAMENRPARHAVGDLHAALQKALALTPEKALELDRARHRVIEAAHEVITRSSGEDFLRSVLFGPMGHLNDALVRLNDLEGKD